MKRGHRLYNNYELTMYPSIYVVLVYYQDEASFEKNDLL